MSDDYTHGDNFDYSEFFVDDELITLEQAMKRIKELQDKYDTLLMKCSMGVLNQDEIDHAIELLKKGE